MFLSVNKTVKTFQFLASRVSIASVINPAFRTVQAHITTMSAAAKRLEGKTVVITGASSGIGRSCAFEFARTAPKNLRLILTARRIDTLNEIAKQITQEVGDGVKVLPVKLDVSHPDEVRSFIPNLPEEWQDIHILINNA